jgi:hypothetical protein
MVFNYELTNKNSKRIYGNVTAKDNTQALNRIIKIAARHGISGKVFCVLGADLVYKRTHWTFDV